MTPSPLCSLAGSFVIHLSAAVTPRKFGSRLLPGAFTILLIGQIVPVLLVLAFYGRLLLGSFSQFYFFGPSTWHLPG
jgi:hypothetical protein